MRSFAAFSLIAGISATAWAQSPAEVDQAEILRLGDVVQTLGSGPHSSDVDTYVEALAPPTSDADKWFISVVTTKGCSACVRLKQHWAKDPWLLALADPADPQKSWSHYNVYSHEDHSQSFRFEGIKVTAYPTVLVQPPRSGKYGDPKIVVFQAIYGDDPHRLAEAITRAIRQYVANLNPTASSSIEQTQDVKSYDAPWTPAPKDDPPSGPPSVSPVPLVQIIPPEPKSSEVSWSTLLSLLSAGVSLPTAMTLLVWMIQTVRERRKSAFKDPLVDQATLDRILRTLKAIADASGPSTPYNPDP